MLKRSLKDNSGQISMEFLISILFVLFIFLFGMMLFQNRLALNNQSFDNWKASQVSDRFARIINNVYLMDNNSYYFDYIYFNDFGQSVELMGRSVIARHSLIGSYSSSPIVVPVVWNIIDVNGAIYFHKLNGGVVVGYE